MVNTVVHINRACSSRTIIESFFFSRPYNHHCIIACDMENDLPLGSRKMRNESECWCPKNCPTMRSAYWRTISMYRWLNRSCNQCWDHADDVEAPFATWKDLSYFPGGLWPKIITYNKEIAGKKLDSI